MAVNDFALIRVEVVRLMSQEEKEGALSVLVRMSKRAVGLVVQIMVAWVEQEDGGTIPQILVTPLQVFPRREQRVRMARRA